MAALNYQTPVLYFFYPLSLSAGQTIEIGITYFTGMSVLSYLSVETDTALNVPFTIQNTTVITHGPSEDDPPTDTTYFITLTNDDPVNPVEFALTSWTVFFWQCSRQCLGLEGWNRMLDIITDASGAIIAICAADEEQLAGRSRRPSSQDAVQAPRGVAGLRARPGQVRHVLALPAELAGLSLKEIHTTHRVVVDAGVPRLERIAD
jgi:hypothetical protein